MLSACMSLKDCHFSVLIADGYKGLNRAITLPFNQGQCCTVHMKVKNLQHLLYHYYSSRLRCVTLLIYLLAVSISVSISGEQTFKNTSLLPKYSTLCILSRRRWNTRFHSCWKKEREDSGGVGVGGGSAIGNRAEKDDDSWLWGSCPITHRPNAWSRCWQICTRLFFPINEQDIYKNFYKISVKEYKQRP